MPKSAPLGLETRRARPSDIPSLAQLLVSAPDDGALYKFPHILAFPDEMYKLHVGWLRPAIHDPTTLIRVAVIPGTGGRQRQQVVGFSSWAKRERQFDGTALPTNIAETGWMDALNSILLRVESKYNSVMLAPKAQSKALVPDTAHAGAVRRVRKRAPPSPRMTTGSYELTGLAVHPDHQGCGVGSLLVRWGLDRAATERVPVFVTSEARGVDFYQKALGFRSLWGSEYWLDSAGDDVSREDVEAGNEAWKKDRGGLSGAEMIWCPPGYVLEVEGRTYGQE